MAVEFEDSVVVRRMKLADLLKAGAVDERVLRLILPKGKPLPDEDQYWDYKISVPSPLSSIASKDERAAYDASIANVIKDVVSFYNVNGGYLIVGVRDDDKTLVGWSGDFDASDVSKRIFGFTRESIDIKFRVVAYNGMNVGILFIPERPSNKEPAQFIKSAPSDTNGRKAFNASDIFLRARDECRPASSAEDFSILFRRDRTLDQSQKYKLSYLENNLPARDPTLVDFVGREEQISSLWRWFSERYTAVKLLSGPGGVGKTSIAWAFCDSVSHFPPEGLSKIIWLTAKQKTYAAILGEYVEIAHTHFTDLFSLLRSILSELAVPDAEIEALETREELIEAAIDAVKEWPCLLVVDDVDSLQTDEQFDVFRSISTIFDRVIAGGASRARALLTARLTLGAAPGQSMMVGGMPLEDFETYVRTTASAVGAPLSIGNAFKSDVRRLHEASSGSPLFASSILRLVSLGESLSSAIRQYKGAEGEEVRRFAFERELDRLTDSQARLLYAAIQLGDSTFLELLEVLGSNRTVLRDDIGSLRDYHLMALESSVEDLARGTSRITVPAVIVSMADLIRKKLTDPKRIENACARARRESKTLDTASGRHIRQIIALWADTDYDGAVEAGRKAVKNVPASADLWCALGRSYVHRNKSGDAKAADSAFRKAKELGCRRAELIPLWCETKKTLGDWVGLIDLIASATDNRPRGKKLIWTGEAHLALGSQNYGAGNWRIAADYYLNGAEEIRRAFEEDRAHGSVEPLLRLKFDLATAFVNSVIRSIGSDREKLSVWQAVRRSIDMDVLHRGHLFVGFRALRERAESLKREKAGPDDPATRRLMSELSVAAGIQRRIAAKGLNWASFADELIDELARAQRVAASI